MNDKDIKDLIQKEKQEVPISFSQFLDDTLSNLPEKKKKKRSSFVLSAVAALVLLAISSTVSETVADTIKRLPIIGPIFEEIGDSGLNQASKKGLSTQVDETISSDTLSLTITDVLYDGTRLSIAYIKQSTEKFDPDYMEYFVDDLHISIDGKKLGRLGMGIKAEQLDDYTYAGVVDIDVAEPFGDNFTLSLNIKELGNQKGNWKIKIPVKKIEDGKTILLQDQKVFMDKKWKLTQVSLTPATTKIHFETIMAKNIVEHEENSDISYQLFDDKGMQLRPFSAHSNGSPLNDTEWINQSSAVFSPVEQMPEYLIFQPIIRPLKEEPAKQVKQSLQAGLPLEISQGEAGKLILTKMEYTEDATLVTYKIEGTDPYRQATLWFVDQEGVTYRSDEVPKKISKEAYEFEVRFQKLPPLEKLHAVTVELIPPKPITELQFKIFIQ